MFKDDAVKMKVDIKAIHFILYIRDQANSTQFYEKVLGLSPRLNVPGMTEFELLNGTILGLMPSDAIKQLLIDIPHPNTAACIPRAEIYLLVENTYEFHQQAIAAGAREISSVKARDWGHAVGYVMDPDGHILAFANSIS